MNDFAARTLAEFEALCAIPHCSFHTQDMFSYLCTQLAQKGYEVLSDEAKNIYAKKGKPKVCLQSHYDMVCVGDSMQHKGVQIIQKDNFLYAKNSSLGADNGIGMACMLAQDMTDIELLFTNDEEVGMIGANHLALNIESSLLLNLDSEDITEIVLGCAGGADIEISLTLPLEPINQKTHPYMYHIRAESFQGGHSGIEIHKDKENVISEFGFFLSTIEAYIVSLNAGEKRNSIPVGLDSIILCPTPLSTDNEPFIYTTPKKAYFHITPITESTLHYAYAKDSVQALLCTIHSGVYAASHQGILSSLNLSILSQKDNVLKLIIMARANTDMLLKRTIKRLEIMTSLYPHCDIQVSGYYSPWEKSIDDNHPALRHLCQLYEKHNISPHLTQIHAGLECGILKKQILLQRKQSGLCNTELNIISIGPTIHAPHSEYERLDLAHFQTFCAILYDFIHSYQGV